MIDYPSNQGAVAWGNMLPQHIGKPQLEGFVRGFYQPLTDLTAALKALREQRGLDTAVGTQLDGIGQIVGVSRTVPNSIFLPYFGYASQFAGRAYGVARYRNLSESYSSSYVLGDEEYRQLIKAKIVQNNGHGTVDEIISSCKLLFNADSVVVSRNAAASLAITCKKIDYIANRQVSGKSVVPGNGTYAIGPNTVNLGAVADPDGGTGALRIGSGSATGANVYLSRTPAGFFTVEPNAKYLFALKVRSNAAAPTRGTLFTIDEYNSANAINRSLGLPLATIGVDATWRYFSKFLTTRADTVKLQIYYAEGFQTSAEIEIYDIQIVRAPLSGIVPPDIPAPLKVYYEQFLPIAAGISRSISYVSL